MYHFEKMDKKLLGEQIEDELMNYILQEPVAIGKRIPNEFELAERFGVGRSTIREAVKGLVSKGILEVRRGSGTYVVRTSPFDEDPLGLSKLQDKYKLALELFEVRLMLEPEIALQAGQTGHYVLSTIHTIDSVEVITRLRKMGVSNYDIASTLATAVSQRLVRKICPHCARAREFTFEETEIMKRIGEKYGVNFDFYGKMTYDAVGCSECNNTGYYDRIGVFEILNTNRLNTTIRIKILVS